MQKIPMQRSIQHAIVLHLYQPPGKLQWLLENDRSALQCILLSYERIVRHAHKYADVARLHVVFSLPLLRQLQDPTFVAACASLLDIPALLEAYRDADAITFIGSGTHHAPLPHIPREDWDDQLRGERALLEGVFGHGVKGYWPPAGIFSRVMIPNLVDAGYEYVLLPALTLMTENRRPADPYRTYRLSYGDESLTVVPCDVGFSQAQAHGLDAPWLADELRNGVAQSPATDAPYLLTSCSDGDVGEWFLREDEEEGFFGRFFSPYIEFCQTGEFPIRPVGLTAYIQHHPSQRPVRLREDPLAGHTEGRPVSSPALEGLFASSRRYWALAEGEATTTLAADMQRARGLLLEAQGSGFVLDQEGRWAGMRQRLAQVDALLPAGAAKGDNRDPSLAAATITAEVETPSHRAAVPPAKKAAKKKVAKKKAVKKAVKKKAVKKKAVKKKAVKKAVTKTTRPATPASPARTAVKAQPVEVEVAAKGPATAGKKQKP